MGRRRQRDRQHRRARARVQRRGRDRAQDARRRADHAGRLPRQEPPRDPGRHRRRRAARRSRTSRCLTGDDVTAGDEQEARRVFDLDGPQVIVTAAAIARGRVPLGPQDRARAAPLHRRRREPGRAAARLPRRSARSRRRAPARASCSCRSATSPRSSRRSAPRGRASASSSARRSCRRSASSPGARPLEFMDADVPGISVPAAVIERVKNAADPARRGLRACRRTGPPRPRTAGRARIAPHLVPQGRRGRALVRAPRHSPQPRSETRVDTVLQSRSRTVTIAIDKPFCIIGERINPTGRKAFARRAARRQPRPGASRTPTRRSPWARDMLDVNAGIPLVDEAELLAQDDPAAAGAHRHPALHRLLGDRGARGRPRRLRGQGARQLGDRRGRAPGADPADRRQARRGRDRPRERRDGHPRDRREAPRDRAQDRLGRAATTASRPRTS